MVGCRYNAKNTLDKNYLYFAEKRGAKVLAETRVVDIRPLGDGDGATATRSRPSARPRGSRKQRQTITARHVVLAASALGTMDLLLRLKQRGSLPAVSDRARPRRAHELRVDRSACGFPGKQLDMSKGIAIGSGIHIDQFTHIEATRYSRGSDVLGLIATMLVTGTGWRRIFTWLGTRVPPSDQVRARGWPFGFARQTLILLVMQTIDATLRMRLRRRWFWPFTRLLCTEGERIPTNIPQANAFAERAAGEVRRHRRSRRRPRSCSTCR